jgi:hypothetical protein
MTLPSLFVCTPVHSSWLYQGYVSGCLRAMSYFRDRIAVEIHSGSFLPRNRDILTSRFLDSKASHMMCIDSDVGWEPEHVQLLLDSGKDFVSGCYPKKQANREIPAKLTGHHEGDLWEAEYVPGGFLLMSRACVERMVGAYRNLEYMAGPIRCWALWASLFENDSYDGEDVSLCRRWTRLGGQIWLHQGVSLKHHGEFTYEIPTG